MGMGNSGSSYEFGGSGVANFQGNQPLSIDTTLSNTRSVPTTPASTPPGNSIGSMQPYQTSQAYDQSRPLYSAPPTGQAQYSRYSSGPGSYVKSEMAPPVHGPDGEQPADMKAPHEEAGRVDEAHDEQESEYTHTSAPYNANRGSYYNPTSGSVHGENAHLSPEMTNSPHQHGSGRATPRTTAASQAQWSAGGYSTPQRAQPPSSLYNVMGDSRPGENGNGAGYAATYASQYASPNGIPNNKRVRELDDDEQDAYGRPSSRDDGEGLKRRKTLEGGAVGGSHYDSAPDQGLQRTKAQITQRRR